VDGDGGADYSSIGPAVADGCVVVVHELDVGAYFEELPIVGMKVAIIAASGERPVLQGSDGPVLAASSGTVLYVQGLRVQSSYIENLHVEGSSLYMEDTQLAGRVVVEDGDISIRNTTIGPSISDYPGILLSDSTLNAVYSSLGAGYESRILSCEGVSNAVIRNSILASWDPNDGSAALACPLADVSYSALEFDHPGEGNINVGPFAGPSTDQPYWFVNPQSGDMHLSQHGEDTFTEGIAVWLANDPPRDLDGDERPTIPRSPDVPGADRP